MIFASEITKTSVTTPITADSALGQILLVTVAGIEVLGREPADEVGQSTNPYLIAIRDVGVPYEVDFWFGPVTGAQRKAYSRATQQLDDRGFVQRVTEPNRDRVTHVRPTYAGLEWVMDVAGQSVNRKTLLRGLEYCDWTGNLSRQFRDDYLIPN